MRYVWDEPKRLSNLRTHRLDFADAEERFDWETAQIAPSYRGKRGEARFVAVGFLDDDLVALVFAPLGMEAVSFISLRPASRKERKRYDER
jgi:hypothetical protein